MDFEITGEQQSIIASIEELSQKRLNDDVFSDDEAERFPAEKWRACAEMGIIGLPLPVEFGGMGSSMLTTALAVQALARSCRDEGLVFSLCAHLCTCSIPVMLFGTEEQKKRYLQPLAEGKMIGGNGSSEAGAGSDIGAMTTTADARESHFIVNGTKLFVSNGTVADLLIIYARHPGGLAMADMSAFIIEKNSIGISTGQVFKKMGLRTCPLCEIVLDNCFVPRGNLLGRERFGMTVFNASMLWERIIMAAYHVGAMEQQFSAVVHHSLHRKQFNKKLMEFQDVSGRLVAMQCALETSRLLLYKACCDYDAGKATLAQASMVKYHASESKVKNSIDAVHVFGAMGYLKESMAEKQLRDSMAATLYSGTSEIQKRIITEALLRYE